MQVSKSTSILGSNLVEEKCLRFRWFQQFQFNLHGDHESLGVPALHLFRNLVMFFPIHNPTYPKTSFLCFKKTIDTKHLDLPRLIAWPHLGLAIGPQYWESFHPKRGLCLVCNEVNGWNYSLLYQVRYCEQDKKSLPTIVNSRKRWTSLIKRNSWCQGATITPNMGTIRGEPAASYRISWVWESIGWSARL